MLILVSELQYLNSVNLLIILTFEGAQLYNKIHIINVHSFKVFKTQLPPFLITNNKSPQTFDVY